ncbi:hypothetical protein RI054_44g153230 [Pseudoscourfieldia marina]
MAYYLKDRIHAQQAMQLDKGGSTTVWVKGYGAKGRDGIVTENESGGRTGTDARKTYSALLIGVAKN